MTKSKLFQSAILWHPTEEQVKAGKKSILISPLKTVLVADQHAALIMASREIPEEYIDQLDQVEIAVRPF